MRFWNTVERSRNYHNNKSSGSGLRRIILICTLSFLALWCGTANADELDDLVVTPQSDLTGEFTVYTFGFTTAGTIPLKGYFRIIFTPEFDLGQLVMASSNDQETLDGGLSIESISGDTLVLDRNYADKSPALGDSISISVAMVGNPVVAGEHQLTLETLSWDPVTVIDSGTTAPFQIREPGNIASFQLELLNPPQRAGKPFQIQVSNARDDSNNLVSGVVDIDFATGTINDHAAPNGATPSLTPVYVSNGSGTAWQTLYKAEDDLQLKGTAQGTGATQLTSPFDLLPNDLSRFEMTGFPDSVDAGETLAPSNIEVAVFDAWMNPKTDFSGGAIYFESSDPAAQLVYNASNPYWFTDADGASHTFSGDLFELRTAGSQTITVKSGEITEQGAPIQVVPGPVSSFDFATVDQQKAGTPFTLNVRNAVDQFGNRTSGRVLITASTGDHKAPNGQSPILHAINVSGGQGSADQTLVKSENVQLIGTEETSGANKTTNSFFVSPSDLHHFDVQGYPQLVTSEAPFPDPIAVTALDEFENEKTDFDGMVTFTSTDDSAALPDPYTFNNKASHSFPGSDFVLKTAGNHTITLASGEVQHTSPSIEVRHEIPVIIRRIQTDVTTVSQGQQNIAVTMQVENTGKSPFTNYQANLKFRSGENNVDADYIAPAQEGVSIPAQQTLTLGFSVNVNASATLGEIDLDGIISGTYEDSLLEQTVAQITDSWTVQRQANIVIDQLDVEDDSVSRNASGIPITLHLQNNLNQNYPANAVIDSVAFSFLNNSFVEISQYFDITRDPANPQIIAGGDSLSLRYYLASHPDTPLGTISVQTSLYYRDANSNKNLQVNTGVLDTFESIQESSISLTEITPLNQPAVTQAQTRPFTVRMGVRNKGNVPVTLSVEKAKTYIKFKKGNSEYISPDDVIWPTELVSGGLTLQPQTTGYLDFVVERIASDVPAGNFIILGRAETTQGYYSTSDLSDVYGGLEVQTPENINLIVLGPSQPKITVNDNSYSWSVHAVLANYGGSDVRLDFQQSQLTFKDASGTPLTGIQVGDPYLHKGDSTLSALETDTLTFPITATNTSSGTATIDAGIQYTVQNTSETKTLQASAVGKEGSVLFQQPGQLDITSVRASQPTLSQGSTIDWYVSVVLENAGEADVQIDVDSQDQTWVKFFQNGIEETGFQVQRPAALASGSTLLAGGQTDSLIFAVQSIPNTTGSFAIKSRVRGVELNRSLALTDETNDAQAGSVTLQQPAALSYQTGSLVPTNVSPGSYVEFQVNVQNNGQADVLLDSRNTTIQLTDGSATFIAQLDPTFTSVLKGGETRTLHFQREYLGNAFTFGTFQPQVSLSGTENGQPVNFQLDLQNDMVNVGAAGEFLVKSLVPSTQNVTQGQTRPWTINIAVQNNGIGTLKFDRLSLTFNYNTDKVSDRFVVDVDENFISGNPYLPPQSTDTLQATVTSVSEQAPAGQILISSTVWMTDSVDVGSEYEATINNAGIIYVQEPAQLAIDKLTVSQPRVTRGQTSPWYVVAHVSNNGGSTLRLNDSVDQTFLTFSSGNANFEVTQPSVFVGSGNSRLSGGEQDSVFFQINRVADNPAIVGETTINAQITAQEINTANMLTVTSQNNSAMVTVQDPAIARIDSLIAFTDSDSFVNADETFYLKALVTNTGTSQADHIKKAVIKFTSNFNPSTFINGDTTSVSQIAPGESKWTEPGLLVKAYQYPDFRDVIHGGLESAIARNTGEQTTVQPSQSREDTTTVVRTQVPGKLRLLNVYADTDTAGAGSWLPWHVYAVVRNSGGGAFRLDQPDSTSLNVLGEDDYLIDPPQLTQDDLRIDAGETDTLIFTVKRTGFVNGPKTVRLTLTANELNAPHKDPIELYEELTIIVTSNSAVQIASTFVDSTQFNVSKDTAHVNINQTFQVRVGVENAGGQDLAKVRVRLLTENSQISGDTEKTISSIAFGKTKEVAFTVVADDIENLTGETITSRITAAKGIDNSNARQLIPKDSTVTVRIHQPARLQIVNTENLAPNPENRVSFGQTFQVAVDVYNAGSESARDVAIQLVASDTTLARVLETPLPVPNPIAGGDTSRVVFNVMAGEQLETVALNSAISSAFGANSGEDATIIDPGDNASTFAIVEQGAVLEITDIIDYVDNINAGDKWQPWSIFVEVSNPGTADLEFIEITEDNITFSVNGQLDDEYEIRPPSGLEHSGNFILPAGQTDTLKYIVSQNGDIAGLAEYTVFLKAYDLNVGKDRLITQMGKDTVFVNSEALIQIIDTEVNSPLHDETGAGLVNRGQEFEIHVKMRTGQLLGVDSVAVELTSEGLSLARPETTIVENIDRDRRATAVFTLTADDSWDISQGEVVEQFYARIISAISANSSLPAQIREPENPEDLTTRLRIQVPARIAFNIRLAMDSLNAVVTGQEFDVIARIRNLGTAQVGYGGLKLTPPAGYLLKQNDQNFSSEPVEKSFSLSDRQDTLDVPFTLRAPSAESGPDSIVAFMTRLPRDLNANDSAYVENRGDTLAIRTAGKQLTIQTLSIFRPDGATDGVLSTGQDITIRAVVEATDNVHNRRAKLSLPILPGDSNYEFKTPQELKVTENNSILEWVLKAPEQRVVEQHDFELSVTGTASDGSNMNPKRTVSINRIVKKADLSVEPLHVSWPQTAMKNSEAFFAAGRTAILRTRVKNTGEAQLAGQGRIRLDLRDSGLTLGDGETLEKVFTDDSNIEWNVTAPQIPKPEAHIIRVQIVTAPNDENTGQQASVTFNTRELTVHTERAGTVQVANMMIKSPTGTVINTVSTQQIFKVTATVNAFNVKDNQVLARLYFSSPAFSISGREKVLEFTDETLETTWEVTAPAEASTGPDSMWIVTHAKDKNSGQDIDVTSNKVMLYTNERTSFSIEPFISAPDSMTSLVSTEQEFSLTARIKHKGAPYLKSDEFDINLTPPVEYELLTSARQSVTGQQLANGIYPTWQLRAPKNRPEDLSRFIFTVENVPADVNTGLEAKVQKDEVTYTIQTVERAKISLDAYLHGQPGVDSSTVRYGNVFIVTAHLYNEGQAGFHGEYNVRLELPPLYSLASTADSLVKSGQTETVTWVVRAPQEFTQVRDTLTIRLLNPPLDDLAKTPALVQDSLAHVHTIVERGTLLVDDFVVQKKTGVMKGETNVPILGLTLWNKDGGDGINSLLEGMLLSIKDKQGKLLSKPGDVFSRIAVVKSDSSQMVLGETSQFGDAGQVFLDFTKNAVDTISGRTPDSLYVMVDIKEKTDILEFIISLDSTSDVRAHDAIYQPLRIADSTGSDKKYLGLASKLAILVERDPDEAFFNYPNPFGRSDKPVTHFLYVLEEQTNFTLDIFTLTGDLVRSWSYTQAEHPGLTSNGMHQAELDWDGTNGMGEPVLNGVYIAILSTDNGQKSMTKIAVVR